MGACRWSQGRAMKKRRGLSRAELTARRLQHGLGRNGFGGSRRWTASRMEGLPVRNARRVESSVPARCGTGGWISRAYDVRRRGPLMARAASPSLPLIDQDITDAVGADQRWFPRADAPPLVVPPVVLTRDATRARRAACSTGASAVWRCWRACPINACSSRRASTQTSGTKAISMGLHTPASNIHSGISVARTSSLGVRPQRTTTCPWLILVR